MADLLERAGEVLAGRYALERELGRGGMARVYLGQDLRHHRQVAVKVLRPELAATLGPERFLREIGFAARLTHPHIIPLHDSGEAEGLLYYVMPFVEGESLRHSLDRRGPLPLEEAQQIAREVGDALDYAHAEGVIHRDIKPANILLEAGHAVVADFGIARAINSSVTGAFTSEGLALGTPAYMSPEQITASSTIDGRADVYSLGCVVYEMLTGEPPFPGPTVQAVAAQHIHHHPPSVRARVPGAPPSVDQAIEVALAKAPEERFATAGAFALALAGQGDLPPRRVRPLRRRLGLAGLAVLAVGGVATWRLASDPVVLYPNRVVVFPIRGSSSSALVPREDATLAILASLNTTSSLIGIDGGNVGSGPPPATAAAARRFARQQKAAFYVDATLLAADSLRLLLDLHDLTTRSVVHRVISFGPSAAGWSVGVGATLQLLPLLIQTGGPAELTSLTGRSPAVIAEFFLGERAYRRAAFADALEHFSRAVAADSGFAVAALRGAQAAVWHHHYDVAAGLVRAVLAHQEALPLRQREFARGIHAWLTGRADTAVVHFRNAAALDPTAAEPWMGLGEAYNHLLPRVSQPDSLAEEAYQRVRQLDSTFAPVLFHLIEFAVRQGDVRQAAGLVAEFRRASPDAELLGGVELALRCVGDSISTAGWRTAVRESPARVFDAAQMFALGGLRQRACARAAWEAMLAWDTTTGATGTSYRFGSLIGLDGVLVAEGRDDEVRSLLERDSVLNPAHRGQLYVLGTLAGAGFGAEADSFAEAQRGRYQSAPEGFSSVDLWFLGIWAAHRGRAAETREIARLLLQRAAAGNPRRDSLLAASLRARATLARGDTAGAIRLLRALTPNTASLQDLTWNPWESLGGERLLLARLLLARSRASEALEVASGFDSPAPVCYLMYLPASLTIRMRAAEQLGNVRLAQVSRERLAALRSQSTRRQ